MGMQVHADGQLRKVPQAVVHGVGYPPHRSRAGAAGRQTRSQAPPAAGAPVRSGAGSSSRGCARRRRRTPEGRRGRPSGRAAGRRRPRAAPRQRSDPMDWKAIVWGQFGAAVDMLDDAIRACPDGLWSDPDSTPQIPSHAVIGFWYEAFHAAYWVHVYLADHPGAFVPPQGFVRDDQATVLSARASLYQGSGPGARRPRSRCVPKRARGDDRGAGRGSVRLSLAGGPQPGRTVPVQPAARPAPRGQAEPAPARGDRRHAGLGGAQPDTARRRLSRAGRRSHPATPGADGAQAAQVRAETAWRHAARRPWRVTARRQKNQPATNAAA